MAADVFEIEDFTNATDWENFIFLVEQFFAQIHSSLLTNSTNLGDFNSSNPKSNCLCSDVINLSGQVFELHCYDLGGFEVDCNKTVSNKKGSQSRDYGKMSSEVSFIGQNESSTCPYKNIPKWFGFSCFVILKCTSSEIKSESDMQSILSACSVVSCNVGLNIPIFGQFLEDWRCFLSGFGGAGLDGSENEYRMDMIHLKSAPKLNLTHLSGLLDLFREHAALSSSAEVTVSACFTYSLYDWTEFTVNWEDQNVPLADTMGENETVGESVAVLFDIPVGTFDEIVSEIQLSACWDGLSCSVVEESESYSDMTPLNAPQWWLSVKMNQNPNCILSQHILSILRMTRLSFILQKAKLSPVNSYDRLEDLEKLQLPDINNIITRKKWSETNYTVYSEEMSDQLAGAIIERLFDRSFSRSHFSMDEICTAFKSAPKNSIIYDLAWILCHISYRYSSAEAMLVVWRKFVAQVREYFDAGVYIPSVSVEKPDFSSCLLNQKLQFLNCCTKRRLDRETRCKNANSSIDLNKENVLNKSELSVVSSTGESGNAQEDEFFDCDYDNNGQKEGEARKSSENLADRKDDKSEQTNAREGDEWNEMWDNSDWNFDDEPDIEEKQLEKKEKRRQTSTLRPPEGRLKLFKEEEFLLEHPTSPLYVPETQEPPIMTEYSLAKEAEFLEQLGSNSDASELRMLIQSRTLLSDMECFKAANPGCVLEDFIRWYSPRDWSPSEGLSVRMTQDSSNIWVKNWNMALPVPAKRQKRLFDDTKEAENLFGYFSSLNRNDLADLIINPLLHHCYEEIVSTKKEFTCFEAMKSNLESDVKKLHQVDLESEGRKLYQFLVDFVALELIISRAASLEKKFCHLPNFSKSEAATKTIKRNVKFEVKSEITGEVDDIYKDFVNSLMESSTVPVIGASRGPVGDVICNLFSLANRIQEEDDYSFERAKSAGPITDNMFPAAVTKEFVLQANLSTDNRKRENLKSKWKENDDCGDRESGKIAVDLPQRMYATVGASEFRVAMTTCSSTKIV